MANNTRWIKEIKTLKQFINVCEAISNIDRDKMKGIVSNEQHKLVGAIRGYVQNELSELKMTLKQN